MFFLDEHLDKYNLCAVPPNLIQEQTTIFFIGLPIEVTRYQKESNV